MKILKIVNDYKEHIPSITTTEGNPFPYQVIYITAKII
jgi:autophagy-related protein 101